MFHWRALSSLRYVTEPARDQAAPAPSRGAGLVAGPSRPGGPDSRLPGDLRTLARVTVPSRHRCHLQDAFLKVLTDSQENLGWIHSLRCRHHHPHPLGVAAHPWALSPQRLGARGSVGLACTQIPAPLLLLWDHSQLTSSPDFLTQKCALLSLQSHVLRNKLVKLAIKGDILPPYHCTDGETEVQPPE